MTKILTREFLTRVGPLLFVGLIIFGITYHFLPPAPPRTLVMTTGVEGRTFAALGERYRQILARSGVGLKLLPSSGAVENLTRLKDKSLTVDVGFLQGGMTSSSGAPNLLSLGSISYTPLWVFYKGDETLDDPSQLSRKGTAVGPEGSGSRKLWLNLLKASQEVDSPTALYDLADEAANKALKEGRIDAVITFGTEDSIFVQDLLHSQNVKLMSISQAEAYTRVFPSLSHVILPKGVVNPAKKLPASDIHLLSLTANLVVRDTMHPALMYLLLDAAAEIHGGPSWVNKAGEFPAPKVQDFPLSDQAERFYKKGRPFLLDYLPFWAAVFLDRIVRIFFPVAVILFPLMRIMPWLYSWRNRSKLYRWYGELKYLELEVSEHPQTNQLSDYYAKLNRLEASVKKIKVPLAFYRELYILREHIELVRERMIRFDERAASKPLPFSTDEHSGEVS